MSDLDDAMPPGRSRSKDAIKMAFLLTATAAIIYILIRKLAGGEQLLDAIMAGNWTLLPVTAGLLVVFILLSGIRWRYIVQTMGFELPFGRTMSVIMASCPLAIATPSRVSDFLRAVGIRDIVPLVQGSGSVLVHKFVDVQSLCLLGITGGILTGLYGWSLGIAAVLAGGFAFLGLLSWKRSFFLSLPVLNRFEKKFLQLFMAFGAMRQRPWRYVGLSLISLLAWSVGLLILFTLTRVFGAEVALVDIIALWPIAVFVGLLPLTIGGMGTRDTAFIAMLDLVGSGPVDDAALLASTLAYGLTVLGVPAVVGIPFMLRYMHRLPEPIADEIEADDASE